VGNKTDARSASAGRGIVSDMSQVGVRYDISYEGTDVTEYSKGRNDSGDGDPPEMR
jgi:hypothetical protein